MGGPGPYSLQGGRTFRPRGGGTPGTSALIQPHRDSPRGSVTSQVTSAECFRASPGVVEPFRGSQTLLMPSVALSSTPGSLPAAGRALRGCAGNSDGLETREVQSGGAGGTPAVPPHSGEHVGSGTLCSSGGSTAASSARLCPGTTCPPAPPGP